MTHVFQFDVFHLAPFSFVFVPILSSDPHREQIVQSAVDDERRELPLGVPCFGAPAPANQENVRTSRTWFANNMTASPL
jgi:hypothetical protein